jgi:RNA recognition motif-containing protein
MSKRLFVGSLAWGTTDATLKKHFEQVGGVESASVIMDRMSGRSKGFAFVEMASDAEANDAITKLNGTELDGRAIVVSEARPKA